MGNLRRAIIVNVVTDRDCMPVDDYKLQSSIFYLGPSRGRPPIQSLPYTQTGRADYACF